VILGFLLFFTGFEFSERGSVLVRSVIVNYIWIWITVIRPTSSGFLFFRLQHGRAGEACQWLWKLPRSL